MTRIGRTCARLREREVTVLLHCYCCVSLLYHLLRFFAISFAFCLPAFFVVTVTLPCPTWLLLLSLPLSFCLVRLFLFFVYNKLPYSMNEIIFLSYQEFLVGTQCSTEGVNNAQKTKIGHQRKQSAHEMIAL